MKRIQYNMYYRWLQQQYTTHGRIIFSDSLGYTYTKEIGSITYARNIYIYYVVYRFPYSCLSFCHGRYLVPCIVYIFELIFWCRLGRYSSSSSVMTVSQCQYMNFGAAEQRRKYIVGRGVAFKISDGGIKKYIIAKIKNNNNNRGRKISETAFVARGIDVVVVIWG